MYNNILILQCTIPELYAMDFELYGLYGFRICLSSECINKNVIFVDITFLLHRGLNSCARVCVWVVGWRMG